MEEAEERGKAVDKRELDSDHSDVEAVDVSTQLNVEVKATPVVRRRSTPISWATPNTPAAPVPRLSLGLPPHGKGSGDAMDSPMSARFVVYSQPQSGAGSPMDGEASSMFPEGFFKPLSAEALAMNAASAVARPELRSLWVELCLLLALDEANGWQALHGTETELERLSRVILASLRNDRPGVMLFRAVQSRVQGWPASLRPAGERLLRLCHGCGITAVVCKPSAVSAGGAHALGAGDLGHRVPLVRVARGARSLLQRGDLPKSLGGDAVVVKTTEAPLVEVHAELCALDALAHCRDSFGRRVTCELLDYGFGIEEGFYMCFKSYPASLRQWRRAHELGIPAQLDYTSNASTLPLYLEAVASAAIAVAAVHACHVVSFDVKADNFLIAPLPGVSLEELWRPSAARFGGDLPRLPFHCVLADFGEAKVMRREAPQALEEAAQRRDAVVYTTRARGTEIIRPPEMLMTAIGNNAIIRRKLTSNFDRRRRLGTGPNADVWALGCLLYETLAGDHLFNDADYTAFYRRVTTYGVDLLPPEARAQIDRCPDKVRPNVEQSLFRLLERDPERRPYPRDASRILTELAVDAGSKFSPRAPTPRSAYGTSEDAGEVWLSGAAWTRAEGERRRALELPRPSTPTIPPPNVSSSSDSGAIEPEKPAGASIVVPGLWARRLASTADIPVETGCARFGALLLVNAAGRLGEDAVDLARREAAPGVPVHTLALGGGDDGGSVAEALDDVAHFLANDMAGADALVAIIGGYGAESALTAMILAAVHARGQARGACLFEMLCTLRARRADVWLSQRHAREFDEWLLRRSKDAARA